MATPAHLSNDLKDLCTMKHRNRNTRFLAFPLALALSLTACGSDEGATEDSATEVGDSVEADAADTDTEATDTGAEDTGAEGTDAEATATSGSTSDVVAAADSLMALLSEDELGTLVLEFGDASLASTWSNLPACGDSARPGLAQGDLTDEQLAAVTDVIGSTLSADGLQEYLQIVAADDVLAADSGGREGVWSSDCYYLAFYGTPSVDAEWAMMFGGHHYARIITFNGDNWTITPAFTGVEPKSFEFDGATVEPLADEVDDTFAFFASLDDDQAAAAEIDGEFGDVVMGPGSDTFPDSVGLLGSELSDEQRALALVAMGNWVNDFEDSVAADMMATLEAELDETYFSWASTIDPEAEGAYGRIDGPSGWFEVVNQAGVGTDDIHHHSIYRDKVDDYGSAS